MDEQKREKLQAIVKTEFPEFIHMLEQNLDFSHWGFIKVFFGVGQFSPIVIYASDTCRIKFTWQIPDIRDEGATINVLYGRSHAPNDEEIIAWNNQKCYCWHDLRKPLFFLDGLTPGQAASDQFLWPKVIEQFRGTSTNTNWTQPEYMAKMHAAIWKYYGRRLFDLFDVRKPFLWEQYSQFVAEYQKLRQEFSLAGYPTRDKVC